LDEVRKIGYPTSSNQSLTGADPSFTVEVGCEDLDALGERQLVHGADYTAQCISAQAFYFFEFRVFGGSLSSRLAWLKSSSAFFRASRRA